MTALTQGDVAVKSFGEMVISIVTVVTIGGSMRQIVSRVASRWLKLQADLTDPSKLRYQAVFMMGAGGSGKGYVSFNYLKYMPGAGGKGVSRKDFESGGQSVSPSDRGLKDLEFTKAVERLRQKGFEIDLEDPSSAKIPFTLYHYDAKGNSIPITPDMYEESLPASVLRDVEGIQTLIVKAPAHEIPSYWRQVNPDIFKEEMPGYRDTDPGLVHEMSSLASKAYFLAALETGDPLFIDGTGSSLGKMQEQMQMAKDAGYRVSLVYVYVPLVVNQIRNATRPRNVHPDEITRQWNLINNNFGKLRRMADKSKVVDNRNDAHDVKIYRNRKDDVDRFFLTKTGFPTLMAYMKDKMSASDYAAWSKLLDR